MAGQGTHNTRKMSLLVGSIDQGTSSTRFIVFDLAKSEVVAFNQIAMNVHYGPKETGRAELDPTDILDAVVECMEKTVTILREKGFQPSDVKAIGVTNQRESTVVWDKHTGLPLYRAILWLDTRTHDTVKRLINSTPTKSKDHFKSISGLFIQSYFSAVKLTWLIENVPAVRLAIDEDRCMFGTIDSWIIWNLTGGINGGKHVTDVSNASRTSLMNITTLQWDTTLCEFFGVPKNILPDIRSSAEEYGKVARTTLAGVPLSGCLGDQQAALVGQQCFKRGEAKNTYGTGCFLICNTGSTPIPSKSLLTTVAYKLGSQPPVYALEGSIATAGAAVTWLETVGLIANADEMSTLAKSVDDTNGVYFVTAFTGLYAPHWRPDAGSIIAGLTSSTQRSHIVRATLEAVCFQTCDIIEAMRKECKLPLVSLRVDGGMTKNEVLMQTQADFLGIEVVRPSMAETTALGAAIAAAVGIGQWDVEKNVFQLHSTSFYPNNENDDRAERFARWHAALNRSFHWNKPTAEQEIAGTDDFAESLEKTSVANVRQSAALPSLVRYASVFGAGMLAGALLLKLVKG